MRSFWRGEEQPVVVDEEVKVRYYDRRHLICKNYVLGVFVVRKNILMCLLLMSEKNSVEKNKSTK